MTIRFNLFHFIIDQAHLAPQSHQQFDFQKYINRSLEEDFKVVVGIRLVCIFSQNYIILFCCLIVIQYLGKVIVQLN